MSTSSTSTLLATLATRGAVLDSPAGLKVVSVLFAAALTAASAQVSIPLPFSPVPLTLQPMIVLLAGLALGSRLGATSQALYLVAGLVGLPVFAASGTLPPGPLRLLGPTGGYLMAYPAAAFLAGYLAERGWDRRYLTSVLAMLAGLAIIYAGGATWLGLVARTATQDAATGMGAALATGVYPFIVPDLVKLACAATLAPVAWRLLDRQR